MRRSTLSNPLQKRRDRNKQNNNKARNQHNYCESETPLDHRDDNHNNRRAIPYVWIPIQEYDERSKKFQNQKRIRGVDEWGYCRGVLIVDNTTSTNNNNNDSRFSKVRVDDDVYAPHHSGKVLEIHTNQVLATNDWWRNDASPPEDLTALEQLHEPAVVHCLKTRYQHDEIYTYTGKILLALNPFRNVDCYGEAIMQLYWSSDNITGGGTTLSPSPSKRQPPPMLGVSSSSPASTKSSSLASSTPPSGRPPPHIYAIAEDAYRSLVRSLQLRGYRENQSILVSGESGAGKTVTTKIILDYLATLSQFNNHHHSNPRNQQSPPRSYKSIPNIETQVLESNPILESFGNARTKRNDNSSRFGKYIELEFSSSGCLVSGSITTYLLEVSRLITRFPDERNYHIFYELLAGLPQKHRRELKIANRGPRDFVLTAHGVMDRRDRIDDRDTFAELCHALDTIGFTQQEQFDLFRVVCGLLYTSNLTFSGDEVTSALDTANPNWNFTTELLGVDKEDLENAFCRCAIEARGEILYKNLSMDRAHKAVEALIKTTYGAMFGYIVQKINSFITVQHKPEQHHHHNHPRHSETSFIGVLDIFGFESFDRNSFEQLCINYCNEALQQQFNRFVFKLEQQEYQKEGIDWSFIEFPDNQDVLDLIEKRHDGILSILDEQSRLQRCTDATFASAIYNKCGSHPRFVATNTMQAQSSFAISHYAGLVEYDTEFFLEKNKDELPKETTELLKSSSFPFLAKLGRDLMESSQSANSSTQQQPQTVSSRSTPFRGKQQVLKRSASSILRDSVGSQFCSQLRVLRTRIESTTPHYVRCLKPNDDLVPRHFDALVIADQLRCAGVLEAIRVSRVGFPHRYNHEHFVYRYGLLERAALAPRRIQKSATEQCAILVDLLAPQVLKVLEENAEEEALTAGRNNRQYLGIQMGKTKVFIRRRAFDCLEYLRSKRIDDAAISIQSIARTFISRRRYVVMVYAAILIQNFVRRVEAYRTAHIMRIENAAKIISNAMICFPARKRLVAARYIAIWCQSSIRGAIARQYCAYIFLDLKASIIQRAWRNFSSSSTRTFRKLKRAVTCIQNRYRLRMARNELRRLRLEQRDLARVAAERDKFREESIRLRKELEDAKNSPDAMKIAQEKAQEVKVLRHEVQRLHDELEKAQKNSSPSKEFNEAAEKLKEELERKERELASLRNEVAQLRSKDDNFSLKSLTIDTFLKDLSIYSNHSGRGSPLRKVHASSPVRSDISLLDSEIEEDIGSFANGDIEESENELVQLHSAIRRRNMKQIEKILHQTSEVCVLVNQGDQYGRTAMHLAALSLDLEIAEKLINVAGAVVNAQDDDGETPLHLSETAAMTELLLKNGKANPNIPNVDGICALHLAVQRRDIDSVRALIMNNANVNNADNIRWFTALHLIALPARKEVDEKPADDIRCRIAHLLSGNFGRNAPDLDYQDSDGNSPLHYAVQLETKDACDLVNIFLEKGANPNLRNMRDQAPLHLLCHNDKLRNHKNFQEIVYTLLMHGADPNLQSLTGCTPLHLSLYHRDVNSAIQLVRGGAELHLVWKKPSRWPAFWDATDLPDVLALDMIENKNDLYRILSAITTPHKPAPTRTRCMHCRSNLQSDSRPIHCRNCSRFICNKCSIANLPPEYFPKSFAVTQPASACTVCERILAAHKEVMSNSTHPTSSYGEDEDDHYSC